MREREGRQRDYPASYWRLRPRPRVGTATAAALVDATQALREGRVSADSSQQAVSGHSGPASRRITTTEPHRVHASSSSTRARDGDGRNTTRLGADDGRGRLRRLDQSGPAVTPEHLDCSPRL